MPANQDITSRKLRQVLNALSGDLTENLVQNGEILGRARRGKAQLVKALHLLSPDDAAYQMVFAAHEELAGILRCEESEDLRQKGIAGLFDRYLPQLQAAVAE